MSLFCLNLTEMHHGKFELNVLIKVICTLNGTRLATSNNVLTKHVFIKLER